MARKKKIGVIEPNPLHFELIQKVFKNSKKYFLHHFHTPEGAMNHFKKNPHDIVLSEYFDGESSDNWIKKLKQSNHNQPLLILTTNKDEQKAVNSIKKGADDYLIKDREILSRLPYYIDKSLGRLKKPKSNADRPMGAMQKIAGNLKSIMDVINDPSLASDKVKESLGKLKKLESEIDQVRKNIMNIMTR